MGRAERGSLLKPPSKPAALLFVCLALTGWPGASRGQGQGTTPFHVNSEIHPTFWVYRDPDGDVSVKEFAFYRNVVPHADTTVSSDSVVISVKLRELFHLIYQRSGGLHRSERTFGHAWSPDLLHWAVDTLAFAVDTTWWNRRHVWSPSLIELNGRTYMFYTGVDDQEDQRIGYVSTAVLDTTNTVWDSPRVMVWEAANTGWAVPDPPLYSGQSQFRDCYLIHDPEHPGCLLMYYDAHDSVDTKLNRGALAVGVARSDSGSVDTWHDLGYFPKTLRGFTGIQQLEGPHVFSVDGSATNWRLMFTNAGSPPGENGHTTIRFENLVPGASVADTTPANWSAPIILEQYLNNVPTAFGWSGSEELHVPGADYLGGFTAWSLGSTGFAFTRLNWNGSDFTLGAPSVVSVDEYRSPARGVSLSVAGRNPAVRSVTFLIDSPITLVAKLELFDAQGRRIATAFAGALDAGRRAVTWALTSGTGARVPNGVYFARLDFAGGNRSVQIVVAR
jgi:sucrose-6-phosphate hydrolase SacC (GH32 family)